MNTILFRLDWRAYYIQSKTASSIYTRRVVRTGLVLFGILLVLKVDVFVLLATGMYSVDSINWNVTNTKWPRGFPHGHFC